DASGSLQFIELVDNFGGQEFVFGQTFQVFNTGATLSHSLNFTNNLPSDSFGHHLLLGTASIHAAGGPTPDFIIPNNFLFTAGGSLNFYNASGTYTALPTDGTLSRTWGDGNAVNSPMNFNGATGVISVPEPAGLALIGLALAGL